MRSEQRAQLGDPRRGIGDLERALVAHADQRALALGALRRVVHDEEERLLHASGVLPAGERGIGVAERGQDPRARGIGAARALERLDGRGGVTAPALRLGEEEQELRIGSAAVETFLEDGASPAEVPLFEISVREHEERGEIVRPVA